MTRNGGGRGVGDRGWWTTFQERYELWAMRALLLGLVVTGLVAGFVDPVGDAIADKTPVGGALLSLVAFVLYEAIKKLTAALEARDSRTVTAATMRGFGDEVVAAFGTGKTDICVLGYTGETLLHEIGQGLRTLAGGAGQDNGVRIRILVPDFSKPRLVPSKLVNGRAVDDRGFRGTIEAKCRSVATDVQSMVDGLHPSVRSARRITCEYQVYDGIPDVKLVILNEETVLYGFYDAATVRFLDGAEFRDPSGADTSLTRVSVADSGGSAAGLVKEWRVFFDSRWGVSAPPSWRRTPLPGQV
ncbi:hypothetical protein OKJ48_07350 [Streptomyces kunmingensis]|uniref:SMODS-associated and fused to various effectors domain-containing protein n=1 Tax=Streptomyces kunmingensis TaxID=68225 RepID=A0ABU6C5S6_9ACTN|nr:hypothetical protein [Streptomyces kunmingensis]MEB3960067.1 hypothetical protein [Streptomyces kunmingensis]